MDWVKLFTQEESVAGLEISSDYLRLALLALGKDKRLNVAAVAEEPLKEGVISNGIIKNKEEFVKAVKRLLGKSKIKIRYAIVSIPENKVFSKIFSFPKSIKGERLEETMGLSIGFQLPIKLEDVYLDWEKIKGTSTNEVLLAAIQKTIINDYISVFEPSGLKIIAVEFHLLSIARSMPPDDKAVLVLLDKPERMTVGVIKNKVLRFMHTFSYETTSKERLSAELKRIINFYEGEYEPISKIVVQNKKTASKIGKLNNFDIEEAAIIEPFASQSEIKNNNGKWLVSAGTAIRGFLPRREDALISLLPVGTEEAYEYQKAVTFSNFAANIAAITSIIFLSFFVGAWFLMLSIQQSLNNQYSLFASLPVPQKTIELETRAEHLNFILSETNEIIKTTPMWSDIITEISARTVPGILIASLSINAPDAPIAIQGTAKDRDTINLLKEAFGASSIFTEINIPLTYLEKKTDIPFSMSFKLKDPESIYLK